MRQVIYRNIKPEKNHEIIHLYRAVVFNDSGGEAFAPTEVTSQVILTINNRGGTQNHAN